jgi:hypothetical protein
MCLTDFIDWKYIHSWLVSSTQLVNCFPMDEGTILEYCFPSTFSLTSPSLPKVNVNYIQTVCGCGGGGVLSCVVDHILQEFNTLFLTSFITCKNATPPQAKMTSKDYLGIGVFKVPSSMHSPIKNLGPPVQKI